MRGHTSVIRLFVLVVSRRCLVGLIFGVIVAHLHVLVLRSCGRLLRCLFALILLLLGLGALALGCEGVLLLLVLGHLLLGAGLKLFLFALGQVLPTARQLLVDVEVGVVLLLLLLKGRTRLAAVEVKGVTRALGRLRDAVSAGSVGTLARVTTLGVREGLGTRRDGGGVLAERVGGVVLCGGIDLGKDRGLAVTAFRTQRLLLRLRWCQQSALSSRWAWRRAYSRGWARAAV
ncbi:uncharacterized protein CTRU02_212947 [Colletotrichum truncatum]|uniref:Uncharacterized protein n=1 Tax=Colletotrichum truncatum TaxID=5467 RepID=A0ACC3YJC1_COLTU